jgi:hypothetical protein
MRDHSFISEGSRREFLRKLAKMAYAVPIVVSVSMIDQRLDAAVANSIGTTVAPTTT